MSVITVNAFRKDTGAQILLRVNTEDQIVRKINGIVDDAKLAYLMQSPEFDNRYQKAWDRFMDGFNTFDPETGTEQYVTSCEGTPISFERHAEIVD